MVSRFGWWGAVYQLKLLHLIEWRSQEDGPTFDVDAFSSSTDSNRAFEAAWYSSKRSITSQVPNQDLKSILCQRLAPAMDKFTTLSLIQEVVGTDAGRHMFRWQLDQTRTRQIYTSSQDIRLKRQYMIGQGIIWRIIWMCMTDPDLMPPTGRVYLMEGGVTTWTVGEAEDRWARLVENVRRRRWAWERGRVRGEMEAI